jgi:pimeloyl-ACP methyl ester carboxylesterase
LSSPAAFITVMGAILRASMEKAMVFRRLLARTTVLAFLGDGDATARQKKSIVLAHGAVPPILPPQNGFLMLDKAKFAASFAADVNPQLASFMASSQVPWGLEALNGVVHEPAWKKKTTFYLIATTDNMIPPAAQHFMSERANATVAAAPGSHAIYVSKPDIVAQFIERAATAEATHYNGL